MRKLKRSIKRLWHFVWEYKMLCIAIAAIVAGLVLQYLGMTHQVHVVLGTVAIFELIPVLWNMWKDFRAGSYGVDILAVFAIIAAVFLQQTWTAIVIVLMLIGGKSLEHYAQHRAKSELHSLLQHSPHKARVLRKGKESEIRVKEVHIGEKIVIRAGEVVPVDAVIVDGVANFDEASLTGESLPVAKQTGDTALSGTINLDGVVTAKVIADAEDSQYQQIIRLVRGASAGKSPYVRLAARYSIPFTFAAFAIAIIAWLLSGQAIRFLEVIVVATPCPLLLAVPIALISGTSRASKYGIIMKNGTALEKLADAQTIAFDKTGTLTEGKMNVHMVTAYNSFSDNEVLAAAASVEQHSNHVLAAAIIEATRSRKLKLTKTKNVQEVAGLGISALVKGRSVMAGRRVLLKDNGVSFPSKFKDSGIDETAVYVAIDGTLAGVITLTDTIRPDSKVTIQALRLLGMRNTVLITGDNETAAKKIAKALGISHVHAEAMPATKLSILDEVPARPLVFVGDGVNDAPILTASDVGIALGASGHTAASESADIVIMADSISRVVDAYEIAKRTIKIATQSIFVGLGISLFLMLMYSTGKFSPLSGAILQELVDAIVIFNALRAHTGALQSLEQDV